MKQTTIAAIATPIGLGGIGIIRISGAKAFTILNNIFIPKKYKSVNNNSKKFIDTSVIQSHKLYYGNIVHPDHGHVIDEVLVAFMKAPNTYTTENITEIQAHSGFVNLNQLLSIILENGAKMAEPGEFTKRAFLNGRIDLTQAEGTIDLINAKTDKAAILAAKRLEGSTKIVLEELIATMRTIQANYEGIIELSDRLDGKTRENTDYKIIQETIMPKIEVLLKKEKDRILYQEGVTVVIAGIPNVGKSSLMNRMLEEDRVIVTDLPGTTRDVIKEHIIINNLPVVIYDTAGLHDTTNTIEQIGINKSIDIIGKADIILLIIDASNKTSINENEILEKYSNKKILIIINKIDVCTKKSLISLEQKYSKYKTIKISAKENLHVEKVKIAIFEVSTKSEQQNINVDVISLNLRQHLLFNKTKKLLNELLDLISKKAPIDILSHQIGKCINTLNKISGSGKHDDLYQHIFSKFCIGK